MAVVVGRRPYDYCGTVSLSDLHKEASDPSGLADDQPVSYGIVLPEKVVGWGPKQS